ncbi:cell wall hydrolase [Caulobacter henricii]|uniref:Cell wall hydrolase n=1 Tax=Caulobacter henricii TaxID=69395 RepID=A0A0P0P1T1_9CAUL|nr:cell wall hydrolase [Caulobacter henricii]ALL14420.1 cell wall hydrolase [Caulobacter henricii]
MYNNMQTRADARALVGAVLIGSATGLALGGVYLAGGLAQTAGQHARVTRLADGASEGFSDVALMNAASRMDQGALAVARRHDPYTVAGAAQRDRQVSLLVARLENRHAGEPVARSGPLMLRASFGGPFNPAASPFRLGNVLESSRELDCLAEAVYYEARGETPSGQAAVAQVVLNRVRHPAFPKSICGVVFQGAYRKIGCQFSFACDGSMNRSRERGAWRRAQKIAERALTGTVMNEVGSATHFHTTGVAPGWGPRLLKVAQVGMHVFYRFGGRAGAPGAFSATPRPSTLDDLPNAPEIASISADGKPIGGMIYAASALSPVQTAAPTGNGMGGPLGQVSEPASAPAKTGTDKSATEAVRTTTGAATGAAS